MTLEEIKKLVYEIELLKDDNKELLETSDDKLKGFAKLYNENRDKLIDYEMRKRSIQNELNEINERQKLVGRLSKYQNERKEALKIELANLAKEIRKAEQSKKEAQESYRLEKENKTNKKVKKDVAENEAKIKENEEKLVKFYRNTKRKITRLENEVNNKLQKISECIASEDETYYQYIDEVHYTRKELQELKTESIEKIEYIASLGLVKIDEDIDFVEEKMATKVENPGKSISDVIAEAKTAAEQTAEEEKEEEKKEDETIEAEVEETDVLEENIDIPTIEPVELSNIDLEETEVEEQIPDFETVALKDEAPVEPIIQEDFEEIVSEVPEVEETVEETEEVVETEDLPQEPIVQPTEEEIEEPKVEIEDTPVEPIIQEKLEEEVVSKVPEAEEIAEEVTEEVVTGETVEETENLPQEPIVQPIILEEPKKEEQLPGWGTAPQDETPVEPVIQEEPKIAEQINQPVEQPQIIEQEQITEIEENLTKRADEFAADQQSDVEVEKLVEKIAPIVQNNTSGNVNSLNFIDISRNTNSEESPKFDSGFDSFGNEPVQVVQNVPSRFKITNIFKSGQELAQKIMSELNKKEIVPVQESEAAEYYAMPSRRGRK